MTVFSVTPPPRIKQLPSLPLSANIQEIPLDNSPIQTFNLTLNVDGKILNLQALLKYSEIAGYWVMTLLDQSGNLLLDSIPLLTGDAPACNILQPYSYLKIGSAYLLNVGGGSQDFPNSTDLGSGFVLVWGDTQPE